MEDLMENQAIEIDPAKRKHLERIGQKQNHIKKQYKIAKRVGHSKYMDQPHRLAKHNALDCGLPDCFLCGNKRKYLGKTIQELRFEQTENWNEYEREINKLLTT